MEVPFDVAERLGVPRRNHPGPCTDKVPASLLPDLAGTIDTLSEQSAKARELKTEYEDWTLPSIRSCEDTVYLLSEGRHILGFVRVGVRTIKILTNDATKPKSAGYAGFTGSLKDASPCCLFDFFIVGGFDRRGLGTLLFEAMLQGEGGLDPSKLAYSRPSDAMSAFLQKHYGLQGGKPVSTFTLFEEFYDESATVIRRPEVTGVLNTSAATKKVESDEPVMEEVEALDNDPLTPYRKDEEEFFTQRTKLYCFNADEWQDAGAGQVTLLKNKTSGRVRLMFVQELAKRVFANHFIVNRPGFCELERHTSGNDKTWTWTAQERVLERRFALKFKSVEEAAKFKDTFDGVKRLFVENEAIEYVIVGKVGVTAESTMPSRHIKLLSVGARVSVVEVVYFADEKRVRARLVGTTEGWITVMSHNQCDAATYAMKRSDLESYSSRIADGAGSSATGN